MLLRTVRIYGYKRFADETFLRARAKATAVIGPNESGKTSLLDALAHLSSGGWNGVSEFSDRLEPHRPGNAIEDSIISARFTLEASDVEAVEDALERRPTLERLKAGSTEYTLSKHVDGQRRWTLHADLAPNLSGRPDLASRLAGGLANLPRDVLTAEEIDALEARALTVARGLLAAVGPLLPEESMDALNELVSALQDWVERLGDESDEALDDLLTAARNWRDIENEPLPGQIAGQALWSRLPEFVPFTASDRELPSFHSFDDEPRPALLNLLKAARTSYDDLAGLAADQSRRVELRDRTNAINHRLEALFSSWTQRQVTVALAVTRDGIEINGRDRLAPTIDSPIEQRSSGLQIFAALLAFLHCRIGTPASAPILLVDEAELHLHYDAQADLMRVLHQQDAAQRVFYSTHSLGCLPDDLGLGVLVAEPSGDERTKLSHSFWTGGPGLSPLMAALGATAVAFTPARRVVIGEGAHEAILLPAMFREVRGDTATRLSFQVVGGLAEVSSYDVDALEEEAGTVIYLRDSDAAGRALERRLPASAVAAGRVLPLSDEQGLTVEDFVRSDLLIAALNEQLERHGLKRARVAKRNVPRSGRASWLKDLLAEKDAPFSRTLIAQSAVTQADGRVVEPKRKAQITDLLERIEACFPTPHSPTR